ncbi:MAG: hypothetical protein AB1894_16400 [Chloroflexota bacterium]
MNHQEFRSGLENPPQTGNRARRQALLALTFVLIASLACSMFSKTGQGPTPEPTSAPVSPTPAGEATHPAESTAPPAPTGATPVPQGQVELWQWASSATASSEYGSSDWSASQATGEPNTTICGDYTTAWASQGSDTVEWLELRYATPVIPSQVQIHQSYNPSQITRVELLDTNGQYHTVYEGTPAPAAECPYFMPIDVPPADYLAVGVRIHIDQSQLGLGWNEIDAAALVGMGPAGAATPEPTPTPVTGEGEGLVEFGWTVFSNGNYVNSLALQDGHLWAGTGGGVVDWDLGSGQARKYTVSDGLLVNEIRAIVACPLPEMRIVAGSEGGLNILDPEEGFPVWETLESAIPPQMGPGVLTLDCDPLSRRLFVGYNFELQIYEADSGEWRSYTQENGLASDAVTQVTTIGQDTWVAASFGLTVLHKDGSSSGYTEADSDIPSQEIYTIAGDSQGAAWLGTQQGLVKFQAGAWRLYNEKNVADFPSARRIDGVVVAPDDSLWIGDNLGQICHFDPGQETCLQTYSEEPGMVAYVKDMVIDAQSRLYYSGGKQGISVLENGRWRTMQVNERPLSNAYQAIAQTPDGMIWVAGRAGLQKFRAAEPFGEWQLVNGDIKEASSLYAAPDGLWIGHIWGASFLEYTSGEMTHFEPGEKGQALHSPPTVIATDHQGHTWFGTLEGLSVWDGEGFTYYDLLDEAERAAGTFPPSVKAIQAQGDQVWVGTGSALYRFDADGQVRRWEAELEAQLPEGAYVSIGALALDREGRLLVGIWNRLARFDGEKLEVITETPSPITTIAVDNLGRDYLPSRIWLTTEESGAWIGQPDVDGYFWDNFTTQSGLPGNRFWYNTMVVDSQGGYWFACNEGGLALFLPMSTGQ